MRSIATGVAWSVAVLLVGSGAGSTEEEETGYCTLLTLVRTRESSASDGGSLRDVEVALRSFVAEHAAGPLEDDARLELARVLRDMGLREKAALAYEALATDGGRATLRRYPMNSQGCGPDPCVLLMERHLDAHPNYTADVALWELAGLKAAGGDRAGARRCLERLVERRPRGHWEREDGEAGVEIWRPHREAVFRLGAEAYAGGDEAAALKWFRRALQVYAEAPAFEQYLEKYLDSAATALGEAGETAALSALLERRLAAMEREFARIPEFGPGDQSVHVARGNVVHFYTRERKAEMEEGIRSTREEVARLAPLLGGDAGTAVPDARAARTSGASGEPRESGGGTVWALPVIVSAAGIVLAAAAAWLALGRWRGRP